jgi:FkbM family methyltransferase
MVSSCFEAPRVHMEDITSEAAFAEAVLRCILLSGDVHGDENVDFAYPAAGFRQDPAEAVKPRVEYLEFFLANSRRLFNTFTALEDAASKELFMSLILFRILGYRRVRIPVDHERHFAARASAYATVGQPSPLAAAPIEHFDIEHDGRIFSVDCLNANVFFTFFRRQYYFRRHGVVIEPRLGDIVVDAGACYGDTALDFAHRVGPNGHVFSFEVLRTNQDLTEANFRQNVDLTNVTLVRCALGSKDRSGAAPNGPLNPGYIAQGTEPMRSLDAMVAEGVIPRVDFLKMDIEGAESDALLGATATIRQFRPRLAISIYHRPEDYYTIREFIRKQVRSYRFYLDNYTISDGETVLYATCDTPKRKPRPRRTSTGPAATTPLPE